MAFEQQRIKELEQFQKQKENEQFQKELDLIIARLENEQIQRTLDAAIERLEEERSKYDAIIEEQDQASQQPFSAEEESSSHEVVTEEKLNQQDSLEQSTHTFDEPIFHHEENNEEQQAQNQEFTKIEYSIQEERDNMRDREVEFNEIQWIEQNKQFQQDLDAIIERLDQQISQQEENSEEQVIDSQITEEQVKNKQNEENQINKVQNTEINQEKRDKKEKECQKKGEKDKEKQNERLDQKTQREKTQEKKEIHRKAKVKEIQDLNEQEEKTQEKKGESNVKTKQKQSRSQLSRYLELVQDKNSESELPISRKDYVVTTDNNSVENKKKVSNDLKTVVSSQSHSSKLKNTGYIFKDGKWHMETEWFGYPTLSNYFQNLSRSKLDGLKLWVQFRNELEAASMKNRVNKPLYYSLKIEPGRDIPQKLIGKRVYVQNQKLYFKDGWNPNKFNYPKDKPVVSYFQKYCMDKIDKTWLNVPPWTAVKIRHAIFQQFYKKIPTFAEVKNKSQNARSKRKPDIYIGKFDIEASENSWIRAFYEHMRGLKTKEFAMLNLKSKFPKVYQYFTSMRYEEILPDRPLDLITASPSRYELLIPVKSPINGIKKKNISIKAVLPQKIAKREPTVTPNPKFEWEKVILKANLKYTQIPPNFYKDITKTTCVFGKDIMFQTPYNGIYAPDLFKTLRSFSTHSKVYLLNSLIALKGYNTIIEDANTGGLAAYQPTSEIDRQLPESLRGETFLVFKDKGNRYKAKWSKHLSNELFMPIRELSNIKKKKTYSFTDPQNGQQVKKYIRVQPFLRKSIGIEGNPTLYVSKYDIETLGAAARLLLQEESHYISDAPNLRKLNEFFKINPTLFKATKEPGFLEDNFTFLVAIDFQSQNLNEWFKKISTESKSQTSFTQTLNEMYYDLARIQLKNAKVLNDLKWSVEDTQSSGVLDLTLKEPGYEIPSDIMEFLKEGGFIDYFLTGLFVNKDLRMILNNKYDTRLDLNRSYFVTQSHRVPPTEIYEKLPESAGFTLANIPDATSGIIPGIGATELVMFKVFRHSINRNASQALAEPLKTHYSPKQFYRPFQMNVYIRDDISYLFNKKSDLRYFWKKTLIDSGAHGVIVITLPNPTNVGFDRFSEVFASAFSYYRKNGSIDTTNREKIKTVLSLFKEKINQFQPHNPITQSNVKSLLEFIDLGAINKNEFIKSTLFRYLKATYSTPNDKSIIQ